jgi:hypothetical protein
MMKIAKYFSGVTVKDPRSGDTNRYLENILVEVTAENYKQMMHEVIFLRKSGLTNFEGLIDHAVPHNSN